MRFLVVLAVLAACDLQPAPQQAPRVAPGSADTRPPAPPPGAPTGAVGSAPVDAGVAAAPLVDALRLAPIDADVAVSAACVDVGKRVSDMMVKEASDPGQRAILEQESTRTIRRTAEACTRDAWSEAARTCFLTAKTGAAMQVCGAKLKAP